MGEVAFFPLPIKKGPATPRRLRPLQQGSAWPHWSRKETAENRANVGSSVDRPGLLNAGPGERPSGKSGNDLACDALAWRILGDGTAYDQNISLVLASKSVCYICLEWVLRSSVVQTCLYLMSISQADNTAIPSPQHSFNLFS